MFFFDSLCFGFGKRHWQGVSARGSPHGELQQLKGAAAAAAVHW